MSGFSLTAFLSFSHSYLSDIKCCGNQTSQARHKLCLPISVPEDDPFYSRFGVKCLEFRRSLAGLRPNCVLGKYQF